MEGIPEDPSEQIVETNVVAQFANGEQIVVDSGPGIGSERYRRAGTYMINGFAGRASGYAKSMARRESLESPISTWQDVKGETHVLGEN